MKKSLDQFISEAKSKFRDQYTYEEVKYKNHYTDIKINCKKHEIFTKTPCNFLNSYGCPKCYPSGYSLIAIRWLESVATEKKLHIQHAQNGGEVKLPQIGKVDGYHEESKTIYEFHGDYFHGNPRFYHPEEMNEISNKQFGRLCKDTIHREIMAKKMGYKYICQWERDYLNLD